MCRKKNEANTYIKLYINSYKNNSAMGIQIMLLIIIEHHGVGCNLYS